MNGLFLYWCLLYRLLWYGILKVTLLFCSFFRREGTSIISCWALYFVHFLVTVVLHKKSLVALLFNEECCFATFKATMKIILFHALRVSSQDGCIRSFFQCMYTCTLDFYIIFGLQETQFAYESLYTFWLARNSFTMSFFIHIQI